MQMGDTSRAFVLVRSHQFLDTNVLIQGSRRGAVPARNGHAPGANPLILVTAGDHSGPPKSLFSFDSSGIRDVGVAGSNPVAPTNV
jgi:hypothetical protein